MKSTSFFDHLSQQINTLQESGLYKDERIICSQQQADIQVEKNETVINFCANNYLGLANHPRLIEAGRQALSTWGYGMASVRFICGTQSVHKALEERISQFLGMEDTILYSSCFDANGGLFETLLSAEDAVISDALNHASIIDGIRLCKAKRYRYHNNDMCHLEEQLQKADAEGACYKLIATDGVFSMDGFIANLNTICDLADQYNALVMVDDSHAVGFMGKKGKGTHEYCNVMDRIDIITGTLGKALGGASGGYTSGKKEIIEWLRQRSRPYLFSNTLAPVIAQASIEVLNLLETSDELRAKLHSNTQYFRNKMNELNFNVLPGEHPIVPVMIGDANTAKTFADLMLKEGIYVVSFSYPVVPKDQARIRTQMSAAHNDDHLNQAIAAFEKVGKQLNLI